MHLRQHMQPCRLPMPLRGCDAGKVGKLNTRAHVGPNVDNSIGIEQDKPNQCCIPLISNKLMYEPTHANNICRAIPHLFCLYTQLPQKDHVLWKNTCILLWLQNLVRIPCTKVAAGDAAPLTLPTLEVCLKCCPQCSACTASCMIKKTVRESDNHK